jgi:hypothetical protein
MRIGPRPTQPSGNRGSQIVRGIRGPNTTLNEGDEQFRTITVTLVTTLLEPVPTNTTPNPAFTLSNPVLLFPSSPLNKTSNSRAFPSDVSTTTASQPLPTASAPGLAEHHHVGANSVLTGPAIIGIIIGVVALIFLLLFCHAWHKRTETTTEKEEKGIRSSQSAAQPTVKPPLLPKFWFEKEEISHGWPLATSGAFIDKFNRLNKTHSRGLRWVADDHSTPDHSPKAQGNSLIFAHPMSFSGSSPTKATVVNTFITELSDELPVAVGQRLDILAEYDDGWTFCVDEKGRQGMVPVECLHSDKDAMV